MAIADRFRHELIIHRLVPGSTANARGDRVDTWQPQDPIKGLIQPGVRGAHEVRGTEPANVGFDDSWGFVAIGTAIGGADYVQNVTDGDKLYEVIGPASDAAGRGRHLELQLLLVVP